MFTFITFTLIVIYNSHPKITFNRLIVFQFGALCKHLDTNFVYFMLLKIIIYKVVN